MAGLGSTHGARLIDSTPPARTTSASPTATARLASITASSPDPQSRFTVAPGMVTGSPASSTAIRATLRLSSPGLVGVAEVDLLDGAGVEAGQPVDDGLHRGGGEVVGPQAGQRAAEAADRRADRVQDVDVLAHVVGPSCRSRRRTGNTSKGWIRWSSPSTPLRATAAITTATVPRMMNRHVSESSKRLVMNQ